MVLINIITFVVLKVLCNLIFMQNFCLQTTADISEISKNIQCNITFIFNVFSEAVNSFV